MASCRKFYGDKPKCGGTLPSFRVLGTILVVKTGGKIPAIAKESVTLGLRLVSMRTSTLSNGARFGTRISV